jgi:hypothetical protein
MIGTNAEDKSSRFDHIGKFSFEFIVTSKKSFSCSLTVMGFTIRVEDIKHAKVMAGGKGSCHQRGCIQSSFSQEHESCSFRAIQFYIRFSNLPALSISGSKPICR